MSKDRDGDKVKRKEIKNHFYGVITLSQNFLQ